MRPDSVRPEPQQTEGTDGECRALSVLALSPPRDRSAAQSLVNFGQFLVGAGDSYRVVLASDTLAAAVREANLACTLTRHDVAGGWVGFTRYTMAIVRALLVAPVDVVYCPTIRATYAASSALYLAALRRPWTPEPALVTVLHARDGERRQALAARHLRYLSDAVLVSSQAVLESLVRQGFPRERACVVPDSAGIEQFAAMRAVFDEASARCTRRSDPACAYAF